MIWWLEVGNISVFMFRIYNGSLWENKPWYELNHAAWIKQSPDPPPCIYYFMKPTVDSLNWQVKAREEDDIGHTFTFWHRFSHKVATKLQEIVIKTLTFEFCWIQSKQTVKTSTKFTLSNMLIWWYIWFLVWTACFVWLLNLRIRQNSIEQF